MPRYPLECQQVTPDKRPGPVRGVRLRPGAASPKADPAVTCVTDVATGAVSRSLAVCGGPTNWLVRLVRIVISMDVGNQALFVVV